MTHPIEEVRERLLRRIELHRAGEAIRGHNVAHVEVSVRDLETILSTPTPMAEVERVLFDELVKRGIDQDTADQTAQAVVKVYENSTNDQKIS